MGGGTDDGYGPINYVHVAYLDAGRYYIDWFKSGKLPRITRDRLFYFYRTEPKAAAGKQLSASEVQKGVKSISGADALEDSVLFPHPSGAADVPQRRGFPRVRSAGGHPPCPNALRAWRATVYADPQRAYAILDKTGEHEIMDRQGITRYNYFAGEA